MRTHSNFFFLRERLTGRAEMAGSAEGGKGAGQDEGTTSGVSSFSNPRRREKESPELSRAIGDRRNLSAWLQHPVRAAACRDRIKSKTKTAPTTQKLFRASVPRTLQMESRTQLCLTDADTAVWVHTSVSIQRASNPLKQRASSLTVALCVPQQVRSPMRESLAFRLTKTLLAG